MNECRVCGARTDGKRLCSDCEMLVSTIAMEMKWEWGNQEGATHEQSNVQQQN